MNTPSRYATVAVSFDTADELKRLAKLNRIPVGKLVEKLTAEEMQRALDADTQDDPIAEMTVNYETKEIRTTHKSGRTFAVPLTRRSHEVLWQFGFIGQEGWGDAATE